MRQISGWALQHKMAARVLIFLSYLLLNACAFLLGSTIDPLAAGITWLVALPFLIALLLYPERNRKSGYRNFYRTQKNLRPGAGGLQFSFDRCHGQPL